MNLSVLGSIIRQDLQDRKDRQTFHGPELTVQGEKIEMRLWLTARGVGLGGPLTSNASWIMAGL
jgi:hypothetical protein